MSVPDRSGHERDDDGTLVICSYFGLTLICSILLNLLMIRQYAVAMSCQSERRAGRFPAIARTRSKELTHGCARKAMGEIAATDDGAGDLKIPAASSGNRISIGESGRTAWLQDWRQLAVRSATRGPLANAQRTPIGVLRQPAVCDEDRERTNGLEDWQNVSQNSTSRHRTVRMWPISF